MLVCQLAGIPLLLESTHNQGGFDGQWEDGRTHPTPPVKGSGETPHLNTGTAEVDRFNP